MKNTDILFITPPFVQWNTPYPAGGQLCAYLQSTGFTTFHADLSLELILKIFSNSGLHEIFKVAETKELNPSCRRILHLKDHYLHTIDTVIRFLQTQDTILAQQICNETFLPRGSRFNHLTDTEWAFGAAGITDKAKHLASLYLEDIGDLIRQTISPHFGFSRYAESVAISAFSFDPIEQEMLKPQTLLDIWLMELLETFLSAHQPSIVAFTIPFPGNLYATLKCGQYLRKNHPEVCIVFGGGYPSTELRNLTDTTVFNYTDYICLDDGEIPLLRIAQVKINKDKESKLSRTYEVIEGKVVYHSGKSDDNIPFTDLPTPDFKDLKLKQYISVLEITNPMHRLWSDGLWIKFTLAHGCYWQKCSFCDTSLDYICRFDAPSAENIVAKIEKIIEATGCRGFHFTDEAAPPKLLKQLALELIRKNLRIVWWTNIRFEEAFTYDVCRLLQISGCIAVSGGLEAASDRILKLMQKGITVKQAAITARNFTTAGIMVHTYLMYGFPQQTKQETLDALEVVRQFFENGLIQSAYWHLFTLTAHSAMGINPEKFGITITTPDTGGFAQNDLKHTDSMNFNHADFSTGLASSVFNFMHGLALRKPLNHWFEFSTPPSTVSPGLVADFIKYTPLWNDEPQCTVRWILPLPEISVYETEKKGKKMKKGKIITHKMMERKEIFCSELEANWLNQILPDLQLSKSTGITLKELGITYENTTQSDFQTFRKGSTWSLLREGLVLI